MQIWLERQGAFVTEMVLARCMRKGLQGLVGIPQHQCFPLVSEKSRTFSPKVEGGRVLIRMSLKIKDMRSYLVICTAFCHTAITVLERSLCLGAF